MVSAVVKCDEEILKEQSIFWTSGDASRIYYCSGGVQLHDLSLRPSVLENIGLPFRVVAGKCGTLEVKYALTRLYSEPVTVTLKDLFVLVIPAQCVKYDAAEEAKNLQQEKMRQLEIFESIKHHVTHANKHPHGHKSSHKNDLGESILSDIAYIPKEASYFDMWVMTVLRNILLKIESVHIRYEDDITKKEEPFAVGLTLEKLSLLTTDATWKTLFVKDYAPETIFKLVDIAGLNLYWNSAPTELYKELKDNQIVFQRLSRIPKASDPTFKSMFGPVSLELKIQVTPFPDALMDPFSKPRVLVETSLNELSVTASDKQFQDIIPFMDTLDMLMKSHIHRKHKLGLHGVEFKGHYKEWWKYAYNCVLEDIRRRRNNFLWENIAAHNQKCNKYLKAYYQKNIEKQSGADIDLTISQLEIELDLFNLILLRKIAEIIGAREAPGRTTTSSEAGGYIAWLASWLIWATPPQPPPLPPALSDETDTTPSPPVKKKSLSKFSSLNLSRKEKEELMVAVGFAKNNDLGSCPDDYVGFEADALLNRFLIRIHENRNKRKETILEAVLEHLSVSFINHPAIEGIQLELKMGRLEAYGGDFPRGPVDDIFAPPQILATANPGGAEYFFKLVYEKAPLDSEVDHKVSLEGLALQFTYHVEAIDRLIDCFTIPKPVETVKSGKFPRGKTPAEKVLRKVMKFKSSPTAKLLRMMENKGKIELSVCLVSPHIVIPMESSVRGKSNFVVVQLGEINVVGTIIGGTICEQGGCSDLL